MGYGFQGQGQGKAVRLLRISRYPHGTAGLRLDVATGDVSFAMLVLHDRQQGILDGFASNPLRVSGMPSDPRRGLARATCDGFDY